MFFATSAKDVHSSMKLDKNLKNLDEEIIYFSLPAPPAAGGHRMGPKYYGKGKTSQDANKFLCE